MVWTHSADEDSEEIMNVLTELEVHVHTAQEIESLFSI
jgi:hypothetical protein